jgi:hypothetical protein
MRLYLCRSFILPLYILPLNKGDILIIRKLDNNNMLLNYEAKEWAVELLSSNKIFIFLFSKFCWIIWRFW